jgi:hypothetical protein
MTTIAVNLKEIAADTRCSLEGVSTDIYSTVKIFVGKEALYAVTGEDTDGSNICVEWLQSGTGIQSRPDRPEICTWDWKVIELSYEGISFYNTYFERDIIIEPFSSFGSGRKVAYYCMKYLGMSPAEAVREACKVDHYSELPIYHALLSDLEIVQWKPPKKTRKKSIPTAAETHPTNHSD